MRYWLNPNSMHFWWPFVKGLMGKTHSMIPITFELESKNDMWSLFDGKKPESIDSFLDEMEVCYKQMSDKDGKVFLRHACLSGKHNYSTACLLTNGARKNLYNHFVQILELAGLHDQLALYGPDYWFMREFIQGKDYFKAFEDLPICPERRVFSENGKFLCSHFYWPVEAFHGGDDSDSNMRALKECENESKKDLDKLIEDANRVTKAIGGCWSVDFMMDKDGRWWLIDIAQARDSWHKFDDRCQTDLEAQAFKEL